MGSPTGRLLELLELLQAEPLVTGPELAARLGVDHRTVRRDVATLQRLGIPVEGERGVGGGYRLRPGYRLPPLMLSEDEAAVIVLGLAAARRLALGDPSATDGAHAKIHRVLPDPVRRRVDALEAAFAFTTRAGNAVAPAGETSLLLAEAIRRRRRARLRYRNFAGDESEREVSPFGLVVHAGRWYLAAHDHGRDALRSFRVDRIGRASLSEGRAVAPPDGFDAVEHVTTSIARVPWGHAVKARLELPIAQARTRVPPTLAELEEDGDGTLLSMQVESLDWGAAFLAGLNCAFEVVTPDELRPALREIADRLRASARA